MSEISDQMPFTSTDFILIIGKKGSGKSTLMKGLISTLEPEFYKATGKPFIKIDPLMEFGGKFIRSGDKIAYNTELKTMFQKRNEFIVTDEADKFWKNKEALTQTQSDFIDIGRHWGLGGMFITRRLARLHTDLVSNANKLFIFKLWTKADFDYLRGADLGDFIPTIASLPKYHFLGIDLDNNTSTVFDPI